MNQQIHGHEVMEMMIKSRKSYTEETLRNEIIQQFGEDTRFYTCSAENMKAEEIIQFLSNKGKFILSDDGFNTDPSKICDH
ncbi:MAG: YecH family protein [Candidatus Marinimicrobia bacterium]|nr:YecH family protein [Candidatus Neomarinimicrobiota bacterium]MCH7762609.1 YecH family protein [Candidatus Neomarinimicrobiota bacterium]